MSETDTIPLARLRDAVERGVITRAQYDAIVGDAADVPAASPEAAHGLNAVTVAYYLGAAAVVFALGWFVAERWRDLGPWGVLAVALVYAAGFLAAARWLHRAGFAFASGLVTVLAVAMAPLAGWALLSIAGWWWTPPHGRFDVFDELRWVPLDLLLTLAALVALRRTRFGLLALPASVGLWLALVHWRPLLREPMLGRHVDPYLNVATGLAFLVAGFVADRRRGERSVMADPAPWPHVVGLLTLMAAVADLWGDARGVPHVALALALLSIAIGLRVARLPYVLAGAVGVLAYMGHLVGRFRDTALFPIALALAGAAVIAMAVVLQRRYPRLRASGRRAARPLPGGLAGPIAALGLSLVLLVWARTRADEWQAAEERRWREEARRHRRASVRVGPPPVKGGVPAEPTARP